MSIKVGEVIEVFDDCENWTTETVTQLGPKVFWVTGPSGDVPYNYHEHKTEWRKRALATQESK